MIKEQVIVHANESFHTKLEIKPYFDVPLHSHPFYEIIYIAKGDGICYTLGNEMPFASGDLFMWGPNLVHTLKCPEAYYTNEQPNATEVYVIHFDQNNFCNILAMFPESKDLQDLWKESNQGIMVKSANQTLIDGLINQIVEAKGIEKLVLLIQISSIILKSNYIKILNNNPIENNENPVKSYKPADKMELIYEYLTNNYKLQITLTLLANMVHMSPSAFCRKFKSHYLKNYIQVLHEIRLGHAKRMFMNGHSNIAEVGYKVGYNSASYFSETFKRYNKISPNEFINLQNT
ncbi:MAG: AraC family transcriptional regulator [Bacteroidota bacterium]|nr:AraC family transcriptional regulator [Bacteroidota bacterium]